MPKRMISTDISISPQLHTCSEFAQLLFCHMIAHQDDWGRMVGDPAKVKARMQPLSRRAIRSFEAAILELVEGGLICWYEVEGEKFIALKVDSCAEYQGGIHETAVGRHRKSQYPAPPDGPFRWPEDDERGDNRGRSLTVGENRPEVMSSQEKSSQEKKSASRPSPNDEPPTEQAPCSFCAKPTKGPLQWFHDEYRRALGTCPVELVAAPRKHATQCSRWRKTLGDPLLHRCFELYLRSKDPFVVANGHSLSVFWSGHIMQGLKSELEAGEQGKRREAERRKRDEETKRRLEGG